ncbi:hypothetical protein D3C76_1516220 [compost metagenome]
MVNQEVVGNPSMLLLYVLQQMSNNQFRQILLEETQKNLSAFAGQNAGYILFVVPQMVEDMRNHGARVAASQGKVMGSLCI